MLTFQSRVRVEGIAGRQIRDFLLNPTDERYQAWWWPGRHLAYLAPGSRRRERVMALTENATLTGVTE